MVLDHERFRNRLRKLVIIKERVQKRQALKELERAAKKGGENKTKDHSLMNLASLLNLKELQEKTKTFFEIKHYATQFKVMEKEQEAFSQQVQTEQA